MAKEQPKLDRLLNTPQAEAVLKNRDAVMGLMRSPDAQRLLELLNRKGGGGLKSAADAAMKGDPSSLMGLLEGVMKSQEGSAVVERIQKSIPKT